MVDTKQNKKFIFTKIYTFFTMYFYLSIRSRNYKSVCKKYLKEECELKNKSIIEKYVHIYIQEKMLILQLPYGNLNIQKTYFSILFLRIIMHAPQSM